MTGKRRIQVTVSLMLKRVSIRHLFQIGATSTCILVSIAVSAQTVHYLDCSGSQKSDDSLSRDTAWNSINQANEHIFQPGDQLLLKRGSTCHGMLSPKGSGDNQRPILIGAYGNGPLPIIFGDTHEAALKLVDQDHWEVARLELVGGSPYGLLITGSGASLTHFRLTDLVVHNVPGTPKQKQTGLIVIAPQTGSSTLFHDIVIDGVTAYDTTQWSGIFVSAGILTSDSKPIRGSDVVVRNSVVHDVAGDGILLMLVQNGTLEWNVSWHTGMQYSETIGTPNGIWEWMCEECVVQYNEGFLSDSPGIDGGEFDIDYGNIKNTVQYNFGHDSQGYCVSAFGVGGGSSDSIDSVIRGNICVENGRSQREAKRQGAMFFSTTPGGTLRGIDVYGNTVLWDPPIDTAAIVSDAAIDRSAPHTFHNNLVIGSSENLVRVTGGLQLSDNEYQILTAQSPSWQFDERNYRSLSEAQEAGQEKGSSLTNARVDGLFHPAESDCRHRKPWLERDIFGDQMDACAGAVSYAPKQAQDMSEPLASEPLKIDGLDVLKNDWTLIAQLTPEGFPGSDVSRKQMAVLQSMEKQFSPLGLHIYVVSDTSLNPVIARNWVSDWNFGKTNLLEPAHPDARNQLFDMKDSTGIVLIDAKARIVKRWRGLTTFPAIELFLRQTLGTPVGMQTLNSGGAKDLQP
jgi:hypothetical protein